jgi:eukaryotic-like serine/threonine-protein kinase
MKPVPISEETDSSASEAGDQYLNKVIADRFQIEAYIGQGSMGTVYRCRHRLLDNAFAVKIIRRELSREEEAVHRFFTEARAASAIGSKHIVEVIDFGELPSGAAYILMEYLQGKTLYEELYRSRRLPAARAVDIAMQIADALCAAHAAAIVHRDLKPDNVFLLEAQGKDFVKILDFGIAKVLSSKSKLTQAGTVIGTPAYMSPEQALGSETDHRTDIYALGIMLYEMACGEVPFFAENPLAVLSMQVSETAKPLSQRLPAGELSDGYEAVVAKCLAKHPDDRFQSMAELKAALSDVSCGIVPELAPPRQSFRPSIPTPHLAAVALNVADLDLPFQPKRFKALLPVAGLALGTVATIALLATRSPETASPAPVAAPVAAPAAPAAAATPSVTSTANLKDVHLVLYPIDARAHDGKKDLGEMPITIKLAPGEKQTISVTRRGYVTRTVTIDDSSSRVVVGLIVDKSGKKPVLAGNPFDDNPYK